MNDKNNDIIIELIPRYLAGESSDEEARNLIDWRAQSPENERHYSALAQIFRLSQKHYANKEAEHLSINVDVEWNHFMSTVKMTDVKTISMATGNQNIFGIWYKIAAAILLLVASGVVINFFSGKQNGAHYQTSNNTLSVNLPDGSQITLNQQSELTYDATFGEDSRTVKLKGEAFFDITQDKQKPFIINVNEANIEVVGTSFNVSAYDKYKTVEVVVKTGIVQFSVSALQSTVTLKAGQKGVYVKDEKKLSSTVNEDVNFLSWNTRKIVFEEDNLRHVIEVLNKIYNADISIATEVSDSCEVTVTFDHQTLEAVMHVLETTLNLTYKINGNKIEITGAGC